MKQKEEKRAVISQSKKLFQRGEGDTTQMNILGVSREYPEGTQK